MEIKEALEIIEDEMPFTSGLSKKQWKLLEMLLQNKHLRK